MKWLLILNPFASLKPLLPAICRFTLGYLLAINVLPIEDRHSAVLRVAAFINFGLSMPYAWCQYVDVAPDIGGLQHH